MVSQFGATIGLVDSDSTGRLLLEPAPGGLSIVQDVANSAGMPAFSVPDLLEDRATAQAWLDRSLRTWGEQTGRTPPRITIAPGEVGVLNDLRSYVREWLTTGAGDDTAHSLAADVSFRDGRLTYEPRGDGASALASLVHLELLLASHAGNLRRLKTCQNPLCGAAFYDLSRNAARVWHDMKTCGNVMNLRASRARRRESTHADR
jgi:predicted RNA-binding Zn ribbon-like protein